MPAMDADAVVALLTSTHPHHAEAVRRFDEAAQIYLHPSVITEFTTVLRRQAKRNGLDGNPLARQALAALLQQPRVKLEAGIDHAAAVTRFHANGKLSFTDCIVAQFAQHHDKQPPITFDRALIQAADKGPG